MFAEMRSALQISKETDILEHVYSLPTPQAREDAMAAIRAIERAAMASQQPQPGLVALMTYLDARRVPKAICTRNFDAPVHHLLATFLPSIEQPFAPIVTREFRPPKPDPAGILHIARTWGLTRPLVAGGEDATTQVRGERVRVDAKGEIHGEVVESGSSHVEGDASGLIMVGDSIDDMTAGHRAGAATVLLVNPANQHLAEHPHTDLVITRLDDLVRVLEEGFKGR